MKFAILAAGLLPAGMLKNRILNILGCEIHQSAEIHPCLVVNVGKFRIGANSRIGMFTCFRDLEEVCLAESARIGQLNWISAAKDLNMSVMSGRLTLGPHAAVTNRHYFDCSGGIEIGAYSTVAGVRSTFISHGIDWKRSVQSVATIRIGSYCIVSSNVNVAPGTELEDHSVVGMGATIDKSLPDRGGLILATRGRLVKSDLGGNYFTRTSGIVGSSKLPSETEIEESPIDQA